MLAMDFILTTYYVGRCWHLEIYHLCLQWLTQIHFHTDILIQTRWLKKAFYGYTAPLNF